MATAEQKLMLQVKDDLMRHEGFKEHSYPDPLSKLGKKYRGTGYPWGDVPARTLLSSIGDVDTKEGDPWTVGFGFTNGTTPDSFMLRITAERKLEGLVLDMNGLLYHTLSWYREASEITKGVLINMAFNMGVRSLLTFRNTLRYMAAKNYTLAAQGMAQSLWYKQTGYRAKELVQRMASQTIEPQHLAKEIV